MSWSNMVYVAGQGPAYAPFAALAFQCGGGRCGIPLPDLRGVFQVGGGDQRVKPESVLWGEVEVPCVDLRSAPDNRPVEGALALVVARVTGDLAILVDHAHGIVEPSTMPPDMLILKGREDMELPMPKQFTTRRLVIA